MISKIKQALNTAGISNNSSLIVALSGGCDSVALLHALHSIKLDFGFSLSAVHVNHGIRGTEATRDAEFVADFCQKLGIQCDIHNRNILLECEKTGESTELCARRIRYEIFDEYTARGYIVATAHTASDNTETVLFNLTRGTGIKGLCGIPFTRTGYIRPILACTRQDTEQYCNANGISYVTDSTNLSDEYTRNFIRHNIIPELKKVNPAIDLAVYSMASQLTDIDIMLNNMTDKVYNDSMISSGLFSRAKLIGIEKPILSRLVRRIISEITDINADSELTERVCHVIFNCGKTQIFGDYYVSVTKSKVNFYCQNSVNSFCVPLAVGDFSNSHFKINIKLTQAVNKLLMQSYIDCDKIVGNAVIRNRMSGDSIKLIGRPTKLLRKLMNEMEIPSHLRDCIPVIADDKGIIFVPDIGVAERVLPDENSKNLFNVTAEGYAND